MAQDGHFAQGRTKDATVAPDLSHWLTKQQAAESIGCSTKTLEKLAAQGRIQQGAWKRPESGQTVAVFHPGDVDRLRYERQPGPATFRLEASSPSGEAATRGEFLPAVPRLRPEDLLGAIQLVLLQAAKQGENAQKAEKTFRTFLALQEAAEFSGLSEAGILRLVRSKALRVFRGGRGWKNWRIKRSDLEAL